MYWRAMGSLGSVRSINLAMAGVMSKGADDGGRMVYDYNAGGSACGQPIEYSK